MGIRSLTIAAATVFVAGAAAHAAVIPFDPDGAGPLGSVNIASVDFLPGNSLNQNALDPAGGGLTNVRFQARLGSLLDADGNVIAVPGLNAPGGFEITAVARFDAVATPLAGIPGFNTTQLSFAPAQTANFIELYYDANPDADDLAGTGFDNGTRILAGTVVADGTGGNFTVFSFLPPTDFDGFGANDYAGVQSVTGIGGLALNANVTDVDGSFFLMPLEIIGLNAVTTNSTPFNQANPSQQFQGDTPNIGAINGVSGPDIQLQTDATASFIIPEPTSLSLLGMGALALAARRRRS